MVKFALILVICIALGSSIALLNRSNFSNNGDQSPSPEASIPVPPADPMKEPVINQPARNSIVSSPLIVTGTVPPGWMFEGVVPIKVVDEKGTVIIQSTAREGIEGSWQSGEPVTFTAILSVLTSSTTGTIVIEKDNPSGLPENAGSFSYPIKFR